MAVSHPRGEVRATTYYTDVIEIISEHGTVIAEVRPESTNEIDDYDRVIADRLVLLWNHFRNVEQSQLAKVLASMPVKKNTPVTA